MFPPRASCPARRWPSGRSRSRPSGCGNRRRRPAKVRDRARRYARLAAGGGRERTSRPSWPARSLPACAPRPRARTHGLRARRTGRGRGRIYPVFPRGRLRVRSPRVTGQRAPGTSPEATAVHGEGRDGPPLHQRHARRRRHGARRPASAPVVITSGGAVHSPLIEVRARAPRALSVRRAGRPHRRSTPAPTTRTPTSSTAGLVVRARRAHRVRRHGRWAAVQNTWKTGRSGATSRRDRISARCATGATSSVVAPARASGCAPASAHAAPLLGGAEGRARDLHLRPVTGARSERTAPREAESALSRRPSEGSPRSPAGTGRHRCASATSIPPRGRAPARGDVRPRVHARAHPQGAPW